MAVEGQLQQFLMLSGIFISFYSLWKVVQATHINISWEYEEPKNLRERNLLAFMY